MKRATCGHKLLLICASTRLSTPRNPTLEIPASCIGLLAIRFRSDNLRNVLRWFRYVTVQPGSSEQNARRRGLEAQRVTASIQVKKTGQGFHPARSANRYGLMKKVLFYLRANFLRRTSTPAKATPRRATAEPPSGTAAVLAEKAN
jgi:hypothetical protein